MIGLGPSDYMSMILFSMQSLDVNSAPAQPKYQSCMICFFVIVLSCHTLQSCLLGLIRMDDS